MDSERYTTYDTAAHHIFFSRTCISQSDMGRRRRRKICCGISVIHSELCLLFLRDLSWRYSGYSCRTGGGRTRARHDSKADILQGQAFADDKEDSSGNVQRDHNSGQGYFTCPYHRTSGDHLGRTGIHEGFTGNLRCNMATLLLRILLSDMEWHNHSFTWQIREET